MALPTISSARSKLMFSSWVPASALVDGVNSGWGSFSASRRPGGRGMPLTLPWRWYSFHPDPTRYPRTIASMGRGLSFFTTTERPET